MITRLLVVLLICSCRSGLIGAPAAELSSPFQEVRDDAARMLRSSYVATPRTHWEPIVNSITNGMTKTNLLEMLSPYHVTALWGMGSGRSHSQSYRLDDSWI